MNCKIRLNIYLYKQTNKTKDSVKTKKKKQNNKIHNLHSISIRHLDEPR